MGAGCAERSRRIVVAPPPSPTTSATAPTASHDGSRDASAILNYGLEITAFPVKRRGGKFSSGGTPGRAPFRDRLTHAVLRTGVPRSRLRERSGERESPAGSRGRPRI